MESSAADVGRIARRRPPQRWAFDRRLMFVAIVTEITAIFLAYMAVNVPVLGPKLTRAEVHQHWPEAAIAALIVLTGAFLFGRTALRARREDKLLEASAGNPEAAGDANAPLPRIPRSLQLERVPVAWIWRAAAFSLATIPVSILAGAHLWLAWLMVLTPWLTIVALEVRGKYARDSVFACFGLIVILQLLHMVEHSTQVGQLLFTHGALAKSHGAIGQLDFETVHFVADTTLWFSLGFMLIIFHGRNVWLWIAFVAASFHQVEHFYLFWLHIDERTVYISGGVAGIMGHHGLIGSPLDRPYLHYTYNFIVFIPMLIAFWDEARRLDRLKPVRDAARGEQSASPA
jgi:hypothetical protein